MRPVVDEAVGIEAGDHLVGERGQEVRSGQRARVRRVELAGQVVDEDQTAPFVVPADRGLAGQERRCLGEELDELLRSLGHGGTS